MTARTAVPLARLTLVNPHGPITVWVCLGCYRERASYGQPPRGWRQTGVRTASCPKCQGKGGAR